MNNVNLNNGPENPAPFVDRAGAVKRYFSVFIKPNLDKSVLLLVVVALTVIVVILGLGILRMAGPAERIPYFVDVERDAVGQPTGRVERSVRVASAFEATEANKRYFIKQWLVWVMSINPKFSTKIWIPNAVTWARGKAVPQLTDWVDVKEKISQRLELQPGLSREVDSVSIGFPDRYTAIAHVTLIERSDGVERARLRKVVILDHTLVPLQHEQQEYDNPIGLTITGFAVNDDLEKP